MDTTKTLLCVRMQVCSGEYGCYNAGNITADLFVYCDGKYGCYAVDGTITGLLYMHQAIAVLFINDCGRIRCKWRHIFLLFTDYPVMMLRSKRISQRMDKYCCSW